MFTVDHKLANDKLEALFIVDRCSGYGNIDNLVTTKMEFLSPSMTSVLQAMDQWIIETTWMLYRRSFHRQILLSCESGKRYEVDLLGVVHLIADTWKHVRTLSLANFFAHAGFFALQAHQNRRHQTSAAAMNSATKCAGLCKWWCRKRHKTLKSMPCMRKMLQRLVTWMMSKLLRWLWAMQTRSLERPLRFSRWGRCCIYFETRSSAAVERNVSCSSWSSLKIPCWYQTWTWKKQK